MFVCLCVSVSAEQLILSSLINLLSPAGFISGLSGFLERRCLKLMPFSPFLPTHFVFSFFFLLLFPTLPFYQPLFPLPPSSLYCSWSGAYFSYSTQWLLRSAVPCCSYQFERMFDTCRIPGILTGSIYILTQLAPNFF